KLPVRVVALDRKPFQCAPTRGDIRIGVAHPLPRTLCSALRPAPRLAARAASRSPAFEPFGFGILLLLLSGRLRRSSHDPYVVEPRRLLEMRLDEIGHGLEYRACHVEASFAAQSVKTCSSFELRLGENAVTAKRGAFEIGGAREGGAS